MIRFRRIFIRSRRHLRFAIVQYIVSQGQVQLRLATVHFVQSVGQGVDHRRVVNAQHAGANAWAEVLVERHDEPLARNRDDPTVTGSIADCDSDLRAFEQLSVTLIWETVAALTSIQRDRFTMFKGHRSHAAATPAHVFDQRPQCGDELFNPRGVLADFDLEIALVRKCPAAWHSGDSATWTNGTDPSAHRLFGVVNPSAISGIGPFTMHGRRSGRSGRLRPLIRPGEIAFIQRQLRLPREADRWRFRRRICNALLDRSQSLIDLGAKVAHRRRIAMNEFSTQCLKDVRVLPAGLEHHYKFLASMVEIRTGSHAASFNTRSRPSTRQKPHAHILPPVPAAAKRSWKSVRRRLSGKIIRRRRSYTAHHRRSWPANLRQRATPYPIAAVRSRS
jgi:hypothetical protein